jgi:hypothetical protein
MPHGWRDVDYVVSSEIMRIRESAPPTMTELLVHSHVIASFGRGEYLIEIRAVDRPATKAPRKVTGPVTILPKGPTARPTTTAKARPKASAVRPRTSSLPPKIPAARQGTPAAKARPKTPVLRPDASATAHPPY